LKWHNCGIYLPRGRILPQVLKKIDTKNKLKLKTG